MCLLVHSLSALPFTMEFDHGEESQTTIDLIINSPLLLDGWMPVCLMHMGKSDHLKTTCISSLK